MSDAPVTREQAVKNFARVFARACAALDQMTAEEIADLAYQPGGPSREEIVQRIRLARAGGTKSRAA